MPRLRLIDFRLSRGPRVLGICQDNRPACAEFVNGAQRRLMFCKEAGDEGWWGSFAEVQFGNISRTNPHITLPWGMARIEKIDVCDRPVPIQNQFYEYLDFGNGRMPKLCRNRDRWGCNPQAFDRNNVVTFADQTVSPCIIRVYTTDTADIGADKWVLAQGLDTSGAVIYEQDGFQQVTGQFINIASPFADGAIQMSRITGFQKDVTSGEIQIFQVNPTTGEQTLLLIMQPGETVAGYRRYYLNDLPKNCCNPAFPEQTLRVTAIVKMEPVQVIADTDYLTLTNLEAVIEESIAIRMSEMDNIRAQNMAAIHHINAVRNLNSEITHYLGKQSPAVNFAPFGSARLERQSIGTMI